MVNKIFNFSNFLLLVLVFFILFWFFSHNPYKTVMMYFAFLFFVCYWIFRLFFIRDKKI